MNELKCIFIEDVKSNWSIGKGQGMIYGIGQYDPSLVISPDKRLPYIGETLGKRSREYTDEVEDYIWREQNVVRASHIIYNINKLRRSLKLMRNNPFNTLDPKEFNHIEERVLIDVFNSWLNKQRMEISYEQWSAGFVLYLLSREEESIVKCLNQMDRINIEDFDNDLRRFTILSSDTEEEAVIKKNINKISKDVEEFLLEGKFLKQGGYNYSDSIEIYSNSEVDIIFGDNLVSQSRDYIFCDHLWNTGVGKDCLCLWKSKDKYRIIVDPDENGLFSDIYLWFGKWKDILSITDDVIKKVEDALLYPSIY